MTWFSYARKEGFPTQFPPNKTPVSVDIFEAGFVTAFIILAFCFLVSLPSLRWRNNIFLFVRISMSLLIGLFIIYGNYELLNDFYTEKCSGNEDDKKRNIVKAAGEIIRIRKQVYDCESYPSVETIENVGKSGVPELIHVFLETVILKNKKVANFGQEWEVAHIHTKTPYRAGTGAHIDASIGLKIGLRGINVTLKSKPSEDSPLAKEIINYNERFDWTWDQGRFGFGPEAGLLQQEFRAAQYRGVPTPILWVVDYFVIDGEGFRFGRFYRTAGWYTHIALWTAFPCWILSLILFRSVIRYGAYFLGICGGLLLLANIVWSSIRNPNRLVIPFEDDDITLQYGFSFWLCLFTGLACVILSAVIVFLEANFDTALSIFFGIDPLRSLDEYILTQKEVELLRDKTGVKGDILAMTEMQAGTSVSQTTAPETDGTQTVYLKRRSTMRLLSAKPRIRKLLPPRKDDEQPLYGNMSAIMRHEKKPAPKPPKRL